MKSWQEKKKELKSVTPNRINELEAVAQLVNAIYQRRIELGWTQTELAEKVGLHQESIARIENGGTVPRLDTVFKLGNALGLKLSFHGMEEAAATNAEYTETFN
jgi:transcriptional regulator with XRE-family HTH domain